MKRYNLLPLVVASLLLVIGCKKSNEIQLAPTTEISKVDYKVDGSQTFVTYHNLEDANLPKESDAELTFKVKAPAGIKQITVASTGSATVDFDHAGFLYSFIDAKGKPWGERFINSGFASSTEHSFVVPVTGIQSKTIITVQVHDDNGLVTGYNYSINPIDLSNYNRGALSFTLHSQSNRTDSARYASVSGVYRENEIPTTKGLINFVFADTTETPLILSPSTSSKEGAKMKYGMVDLPTSTVFKESSLDVGIVKPMDLVAVESDASFKSILEVESGKAYVFVTSTNIKGLIKVNSLSDDGNGNANSVLNYTIISITETR